MPRARKQQRPRRAIRTDAVDKYYNAPLTDFNPEHLRRARAEQETGYLIDTDRLFSAMYHEWDTLQKDVNTMAGSVQTLTFRAVPATREGELPDERAQKVADTVNAALWKGAAAPVGEWEHSFTDLLGCLYHALCRGVNVHEIEWSYDGAARLWFPRAYLPVSPAFYRWEMRHGQKDRLLLHPEGAHSGSAEGIPFPEGDFIVALNTQGPDHPMRNALFSVLVPWFGAAHWGLKWLTDYCQIYGIPFRSFRIQNKTRRAELEAALRGGAIIQDIFLDKDDAVEVVTGSTGTNIPQQELVSLAQKHCHEFILGQTLTSDTSNGGSRAQAEVHLEVQSAQVLAVGNYVASVLTAQLVPAIVRRNFGRLEGCPLPEIRCSLPGSKASKEKIEIWEGILRLGLKVSAALVRDDLGIPAPKEGEEVLGPVQATPPGMDALSAAAAVLAASRPKA